MFAELLTLGWEQGGNVPMVVETLCFDAAQITSKANGNRPEWGGAATPYPATLEELS